MINDLVRRWRSHKNVCTECTKYAVCPEGYRIHDACVNARIKELKKR